MTTNQVKVAAEALAASILAQAGYDVAVQWGGTQPHWDMIAVKKLRILKLSVKGSQDGGWPLFPSYLKNARYHTALDRWLAHQPKDLVYFFVQFKNVNLGQAPSCYIALPKEIVAHMRTTRGGNAYTSLRVEHHYSKGLGAGHTDLIPAQWIVTQERLDQI